MLDDYLDVIKKFPNEATTALHCILNHIIIIQILFPISLFHIPFLPSFLTIMAVRDTVNSFRELVHTQAQAW